MPCTTFGTNREANTHKLIIIVMCVLSNTHSTLCGGQRLARYSVWHGFNGGAGCSERVASGWAGVFVWQTGGCAAVAAATAYVNRESRTHYTAKACLRPASDGMHETSNVACNRISGNKSALPNIAREIFCWIRRMNGQYVCIGLMLGYRL